MHTRSGLRVVDSAARIKLLSVLVVVSLVAAACGGGDEEEPEAAVPEAEPILCPMTGEETGEDFPVDRPALAVKIDNAPPARPQVGLEAADVVYEELGEGGLTRFLAVFHCDDAGDLGPVRSARNVDPDIMQEFAPVLFGNSGANDQVLAKINNTEGVINLRHGTHGDAYRREASRRSPYNLFTTTEALRSLEDAQGVQGPPPVGFVFNPELLEAEPQDAESPAEGDEEASPSPAAVAEPAESVAFEFSAATRVRYEYDEGSRQYLRFHGDEAHTLASGEQAAATNVVIMKVQITAGTVRDASGSLTQDTDVVGSGEVVVLRGGTVEFGTWNRPSLDASTTFENRNGQVIELAPGTTWIHLVDQAQAVNVSPGT